MGSFAPMVRLVASFTPVGRTGPVGSFAPSGVVDGFVRAAPSDVHGGFVRFPIACARVGKMGSFAPTPLQTLDTVHNGGGFVRDGDDDPPCVHGFVRSRSRGVIGSGPADHPLSFSIRRIAKEATSRIHRMKALHAKSKMQMSRSKNGGSDAVAQPGFAPFRGPGRSSRTYRRKAFIHATRPIVNESSRKRAASSSVSMGKFTLPSVRR